MSWYDDKKTIIERYKLKFFKKNHTTESLTKKRKEKKDIAMPSLHAQKPFLYQIESHSNFRVQSHPTGHARCQFLNHTNNFGQWWFQELFSRVIKKLKLNNFFFFKKNLNILSYRQKKKKRKKRS